MTHTHSDGCLCDVAFNPGPAEFEPAGGHTELEWADARDACAKPYLTEGQAHEAAITLQRAGWRLEWRNPPPEFGAGTGTRIAASVYDPAGGDTPGDVMFRISTET
jgi:hypothetical protein